MSNTFSREILAKKVIFQLLEIDAERERLWVFTNKTLEDIRLANYTVNAALEELAFMKNEFTTIAQEELRLRDSIKNNLRGLKEIFLSYERFIPFFHVYAADYHDNKLVTLQKLYAYLLLFIHDAEQSQILLEHAFKDLKVYKDFLDLVERDLEFLVTLNRQYEALGYYDLRPFHPHWFHSKSYLPIFGVSNGFEKYQDEILKREIRENIVKNQSPSIHPEL